MVDPKIEEQASLYVLDLLEPAQQREFEALQREQPAVRAATRDLQVNLTALAAAAPPLPAPPGTLDRIQARIHGGFWASARNSYDRWAGFGWPLAACLAVGWLVSAFYWFQYLTPRPNGRAAALPEHTQPAPASPQRLGPAPVEADAQKLASELTSQHQQISRLNDELNKEQEKTRRQAARLGQLNQNAARLEERLRLVGAVQPGLKRLVIVNLRDPSAGTAPTDVLADPSRIIANEAARRVGPVSVTPGSTDQGPAATATVNGTPAVGSPTSVSSSLGPTLPPAADTLHSPAADTQTSPAPVAGASNAVGLAVYDQSAQGGSLVLQGLASLTGNSSYQVWAVDPQYAQPVSVGLVTTLTNGFGQFTFNVPGLNLSPTRFMITLEPAGGSTQPTGPVVLDGPSP